MKLNILISAYACNPYLGSESQVGWNFTSRMSKKHKITWYTKRDGDYYLISGSEFPEKKLDPKTKTYKKIRSNRADLKLMFFIALGSFIGVGLATLILSIVL